MSSFVLLDKKVQLRTLKNIETHLLSCKLVNILKEILNMSKNLFVYSLSKSCKIIST